MSDPAAWTVAGWEGIAWQLWRRNRYSFREVSNYLAAEGWSVHPLLIEAECMRRAYERIENFSGVVTRPGPRGSEGR